MCVRRCCSRASSAPFFRRISIKAHSQSTCRTAAAAAGEHRTTSPKSGPTRPQLWRACSTSIGPGRNLDDSGRNARSAKAPPNSGPCVFLSRVELCRSRTDPEIRSIPLPSRSESGRSGRILAETGQLWGANPTLDRPDISIEVGPTSSKRYQPKLGPASASTKFGSSSADLDNTWPGACHQADRPHHACVHDVCCCYTQQRVA